MNAGFPGPVGRRALSVCISLVSCQKHLEGIILRYSPAPEDHRSETCQHPSALVAFRGGRVCSTKLSSACWISGTRSPWALLGAMQ